MDAFLQSNNDRDTFWYRGHAQFGWLLTPTALRHADENVRKKALSLVHEFKRVAMLRLGQEERPRGGDDDLQWLGLAQHYGLPTRLLDWSENPTIGLYFACLGADKDGAVFLLNPADLNFSAIKKPRILRADSDAAELLSYVNLLPRSRAKRPTVAMHPVYNSGRILLQKGAFTIHGNKRIALDEKQAPSLVCLPILKEHKSKLASELDRIGVDEMALFPDPEHVCRHLKKRIGM